MGSHELPIGRHEGLRGNTWRAEGLNAAENWAFAPFLAAFGARFPKLLQPRMGCRWAKQVQISFCEQLPLLLSTPCSVSVLLLAFFFTMQVVCFPRVLFMCR